MYYDIVQLFEHKHEVFIRIINVYILNVCLGHNNCLFLRHLEEIKSEYFIKNNNNIYWKNFCLLSLSFLVYKVIRFRLLKGFTITSSYLLLWSPVARFIVAPISSLPNRSDSAAIREDQHNDPTGARAAGSRLRTLYYS